KIDKDILKRAPGINSPAFDTDTEVPVEKVLEIDTTAEGMIRFEVAIILPVVSCENVSPPQTDVELVVCVPLRTGWRRHLFHLFSGISFSPSKRCRSECSDAQQPQHWFFHSISPLVRSLLSFFSSKHFFGAYAR